MSALRLAYVDEGAGPPWVFLHNGGTSHLIWDAQVRALSPSCRCVVPDLPGYGASTEGYRPTGLDGHVEVLRRLCDHLELEEITLVGNCMGSAIACAFARRYPHRVRALHLCNVLSYATVKVGMFWPIVRLGHLGDWGRRQLRTGFAPLPILPPVARWLVRAQFVAPPTRELSEALVGLYRGRHQVGGILDLLVDQEAFARLDHQTWGPELPPLRVLWGRGNRVLPVGAGEALCQRLGVPLTVMEGGHLLMCGRPEAVTSWLLEGAGPR